MEGYQAPQTTGTEVLGYKGDANLAGGFDSKGVAIGAGEGSVTPVMDMLKTLQGQQFTRNMAEWQQKIKERDQSIAMLNDPSLQIDMDVADQDRDALNQQRQKIIDMWRSNPNMNSTDAIVNFQKEAGLFRQMSVSSKSRSLEYKKQIQAIAGETNQTVRQGMLKHLDEQMKAGVYHQVVPYFKNPTFDASMFTDVPMQKVGLPEYKQDENGAYVQSTTMRTPMTAFSTFVAPEGLLANNGKKLQDLQMFHDNFVNSPFAKDDNNLTAINQKLATINATNNLSPSDPNFLKPIAVNDGTGWKINDSPAEFGKSFYAYSHYQEKVEKALAPDYQKQMDLNAKIGHEQAQTITEQHKPAEVDAAANLKNTEAWEKKLTAPAIEDHYRAESEKLRKDGDLVAAKTADMKSTVSAPASDGLHLFNDVAKYNSFTGQDVKDKFSSKLIAGLKQAGFEDDNDLIPLPKNQSAMAALSIPKTDKAGNVGGDVTKPTFIYAIRPKGSQSLRDIKLVGLDKEGKFMKSVNVKEVAGEIIKFNQNFKTNDKTSKQIDAARLVTDEMLGQLPTEQGNAGSSAPASAPAPAVHDVPYNVKSLPGGDKAVPIVVAGTGTFYKIGDKYFDENGNEVKE